MTTTITQQDIDTHNRDVIARTVAHQIWKQTSRMDTPTRMSTWARRGRQGYRGILHMEFTDTFYETVNTIWDSEEEPQMHLIDADAVAVFLSWGRLD